MPSIISGSLMRATPPCTRMSAGTRSRAMTARGAGVLGDLGLLGRDHVHDDAALEHLGQPALDAEGAGRSRRGGSGLVGHAAQSRAQVSGLDACRDSVRDRRAGQHACGGSQWRRSAPPCRASTDCPSEARPRRRRGRNYGNGTDSGSAPTGISTACARLGQLHPRAPGGELDRVAGGVLVDRRLLRVGAAPRALHDLAVGEDPGLALAHRDRLLRLAHAGHAHVRHELDHHVGRGDLHAVVVDVGRAVLLAQPRLGGGVPQELGLGALHLQPDAGDRVTDRRRLVVGAEGEQRRRRALAGRGQRVQRDGVGVERVLGALGVGAVVAVVAAGAVGLALADVGEVGSADLALHRRVAARPGEQRVRQRRPRGSRRWCGPSGSGPTGVESADWNTAKNRVMPSTSSSYTTSAWLSPVCGRASAWLSIFTTSAGRFCVAGSVTGRPVNA